MAATPLDLPYYQIAVSITEPVNGDQGVFQATLKISESDGVTTPAGRDEFLTAVRAAAAAMPYATGMSMTRIVEVSENYPAV
jgi:hypothetical protein